MQLELLSFDMNMKGTALIKGPLGQMNLNVKNSMKHH